jgi:hypothetical protein
LAKRQTKHDQCTEPESIARAAPPLDDYVVLGNAGRLAQWKEPRAPHKNGLTAGGKDREPACEAFRISRGEIT